MVVTVRRNTNLGLLSPRNLYLTALVRNFQNNSASMTPVQRSDLTTRLSRQVKVMVSFRVSDPGLRDDVAGEVLVDLAAALMAGPPPNPSRPGYHTSFLGTVRWRILDAVRMRKYGGRGSSARRRPPAGADAGDGRPAMSDHDGEGHMPPIPSVDTEVDVDDMTSFVDKVVAVGERAGVDVTGIVLIALERTIGDPYDRRLFGHLRRERNLSEAAALLGSSETKARERWKALRERWRRQVHLQRDLLKDIDDMLARPRKAKAGRSPGPGTNGVRKP